MVSGFLMKSGLRNLNVYDNSSTNSVMNNYYLYLYLYYIKNYSEYASFIKNLLS